MPPIEQRLNAALTEPGVRRFTMGRRSSRGWIIIAGETLDDDTLQRWLELARGYVATFPPK